MPASSLPELSNPQWCLDSFLSWLSSANPRCVTDRSLHNAGPAHLHPHRGRDQRDHRGLCEYSSSSVCHMVWWKVGLFEVGEREREKDVFKANASSSFTEKTQSRQHSQQEEYNRYLCACVRVHQLSTLFHECACIYLFGFCFPFMAEWKALACHSLRRRPGRAPDKSLAAMNTVWALLYRLTDGCVVLVSQCCGTEPGRQSSGNRYH